MKNLFLFICIVLLTTSIHAQSSSRFGVTSGLNFSKYMSADLNYATGFRFGASVEFGLPSIYRNMYVNSTLLLSQKGGKSDDLDNLRINAYYIELPIHIGIKQRLSDKFSLFEQAGPYIGLGLFGKTKADSYYSSFLGQSDGYKYDTFSESGLRRWDLGLGFRIGTEYMNHVRLAWGMDFGTLKVSKNSNATNFSTDIALSYLF